MRFLENPLPKNEEELVRFLSDKLYEIADVMMTYYDPCEMRDDKCKAYREGGNMCCHHTTFGSGLCPFWKNMCTNPNADCRLWLCRTALETTDPKCKEALLLLQQFGKLYGIIKDPLNGHPYVGADRQPK